MLIGLLILTTSGSINFTGEDWGRLGFIFLVSLLYIGVFLMLGLLVSSRTNRSTTALMMLLFIWVVIVLAVPKVSMIIASKARRVPSVQEVQADKDAARAQIIKDAQERMFQYIREQQGKQPKASDEEVRAKIAEMQEEVTVSITRETQKIQAEYERRKAAQFGLASNISRTSPASVYTYAATGPKLMQQQAQRIKNEKVEEVKVDLSELPTLEFREADLSESWNSVWVDFLILFLLVACFFMIAYVGFVRSDVR
jgi:ABC-type transport system involved in multi-copper enzyme maturation permease subunit